MPGFQQNGVAYLAPYPKTHMEVRVCYFLDASDIILLFKLCCVWLISFADSHILLQLTLSLLLILVHSLWHFRGRCKSKSRQWQPTLIKALHLLGMVSVVLLFLKRLGYIYKLKRRQYRWWAVFDKFHMKNCLGISKDKNSLFKFRKVF